MAAVAAPGSNAISTNPLPPPALASTQPQSPNYLQRCVEELTPEVTAKRISGHEFDSRLWKGAAIATLVVFTLLAVGTFVAAGVFFPAYLPIVAITAFCFMPWVIQRYKGFDQDSFLAQENANRLKAIAQEFNALPSDARVIGQKLTVMRVPGAETLSNPTQFRPLIAHYDYWFKQREKDTTEATTLLSAVARLNTQATDTQEEEKKSSLLDRVSDLRLEALQAQDRALTAKVNAAFIHAVIQRPEFAGDLGDLGMLYTPSFGQREALGEQALALHFGDRTADHFLMFKNQNIQAITRDELSNDATMPIRLVAERFVQAMAAPAVA